MYIIVCVASFLVTFSTCGILCPCGVVSSDILSVTFCPGIFFLFFVGVCISVAVCISGPFVHLFMNNLSQFPRNYTAIWTILCRFDSIFSVMSVRLHAVTLHTILFMAC